MWRRGGADWADSWHRPVNYPEAAAVNESPAKAQSHESEAGGEIVGVWMDDEGRCENRVRFSIGDQAGATRTGMEIRRRRFGEAWRKLAAWAMPWPCLGRRRVGWFSPRARDAQRGVEWRRSGGVGGSREKTKVKRRPREAVLGLVLCCGGGSATIGVGVWLPGPQYSYSSPPALQPSSPLQIVLALWALGVPFRGPLDQPRS